MHDRNTDPLHRGGGRPDSAGPAWECPLPWAGGTTVQLAHGGGGGRTRELIERVFRPAFDNPFLAARHDSAVLDLHDQRIAFTTDSYVVSPLFFPGGDIGTLAVYGTVNDLAMAGAAPAYLSAAFIIEEGLPFEDLVRIVASMRTAAHAAGVCLVTGDTKVVDRGKGDGVFISTAGIGFVPRGIEVTPARVRPDDAVLLSGDVGRHGIAILSVREGLRFSGDVASDCAPLGGTVAALVAAGIDVHCLRDLTRGGLATALNEIALDGAVDIRIDEDAIPITEPVAAACEVLGLDPLYVANEGRFIAFVPAAQVPRALEVLRQQPVASGATKIGTVSAAWRSDAGHGGGHPGGGVVRLRGRLGPDRILDLLSGEQLPRIC